MNICFIPHKNKYQGKRVYIIGNGPSLKNTDLNLIKNEYSIAMNRISLIYDSTEWRPSFYIFCSTNCQHKIWGKEWTSSIHKAIKEKNTTSFIYKRFRNTIDPQNKHGINWIKNISENKPKPNGDILDSSFSNNIEERIDKSASTVNVALQMAKYMGFSEIIVLGCDLGWTADKGYNNDQNHFTKSYNADIPSHKVVKINKQMRNVHRLARKNIDDNVKMYNASIKTTLDTYPLIDYNSITKENKVVLREDELKKNKIYWENY